MTTNLHILTNPLNPISLSNRVDPFSPAAVKFIKYMSEYGWNCIHYGVEGAEAPCEIITCNKKHSSADIYNSVAGAEISKRKKHGDVIVCFYGLDNKGAADYNSDLKVIEPSIGYDVSAVFAPYRVFVSYAQMHMYYGSRGMLMNPSWFDAVIPNAFTVEEFNYSENKEDFILMFGRVIETKGIHIAIQATQETGQRLIIAGPGKLQDLGYTKVPDHVTEVGVCNTEQRKQLMSRAKAIIGPTTYVEPFGNMIIEGYLSGTPAITSDWGGFSETVINGLTGYRCREFKEFVDAIKNISRIDSKNCYNYAANNYSDEAVHIRLNEYLKKVQCSDFYRK